MAGTTELATVDPGRVVATSGARFTSDQVEVIRNLFAKGASEDELVVFLSIAQKYDLDPFAREIWCICELEDDGSRKTDRNGQPRPPMIQASRAGWRKVAQRDPRCAGIEAAAVYSKDTFRRLPDGRVEHTICLDVTDDGRQDRGKIVGAYALVFRHDWARPAYAWASWQDYGVPQVSERESRNGQKYKPTYSPWYRFPSAMIEKQAESMALRQAFPLGAIASGDDRDVELADGDVVELPAETTPNTPHARGTRPASTGAPRPTQDAQPRRASSSPESAHSDGSDAAAAAGGSQRPVGDTAVTGTADLDSGDPVRDAAATARKKVAAIGTAPLAGTATLDVAGLCAAAKPMKRADLVRVARWSTRGDEWPAMALAELDAGRASELIQFFAAASDIDREALAAAVVEWEDEQTNDDPQGRLA